MAANPVRAALLDAGPLIALFDRSDRMHADMEKFFSAFAGRAHTTWLVVTEVCHFLNVREQRAFLAWLRRGGAELAQIDDAALDSFDIMLDKYSDQPMDIADASLVWLGEKLRITDIITIDHSDFSTYRTAAGKRFRNLLPSH